MDNSLDLLLLEWWEFFNEGKWTEEQIEEIIAPTLLYCGWFFFYSIIVPRAVKLPKENNEFLKRKQKGKRKRNYPEMLQLTQQSLLLGFV